MKAPIITEDDDDEFQGFWHFVHDNYILLSHELRVKDKERKGETEVQKEKSYS